MTRGLTTEVSLSDSASPVTFLGHRRGDDVAVAVRDAQPGDAPAAYLDDGTRVMVAVRVPVPLGHKVALRDLAENDTVIEYGLPIGRARCAIGAGDLVHTHNLRSARWQHSL
jgi:(2R)-sulfolactate sulfo-lyase subunit alpha